MLKRSLVALLLTWPLSTTAVPLMDLVDIEGIRGNQLIGYGLVVGLDGTGDKNRLVRYIPVANGPHGINTAPDGIHIVANGKLSPTVTVFDVRKFDDLFADKIQGRDCVVAEPELGVVYTGKVVKLVDFGAFVNFFGKRDGLVHVSQISGKRLQHPNEVLKEGQEVKVKLLGFDDRGKVRLGMKMVDQETGQEITESKEETAE